MNKVITINLNGRAYQLEESGFDALRAYLDDASARLENDEGKAEIISDLEQAIAEKCDKVLSPHKTVVTDDEIKRIIDEMGPVEGTKAESAAGGAEHASSHGTSNAPKRLYLIREGAILTGVCTGLAAYFDIDVTLVRVIFAVVTILTSGIGIPVYIALALILPYADTIEARAAAHGQAFKAQDIVDRAKERFEATFERVAGHRMDWGDEGTNDWKEKMKRAHAAHVNKHWKREMKQEWRKMRRDYHHPNPALGLISGALGLLWIFALLSLITTGAIFGWVVPAGIPIWVAIVLLFVVYHALTGPLRGARHSYQWQDQYYPGYDAWKGFAGVLSAIFIVIAFGWAYLHIPQVHSFVLHPVAGIKEMAAWLKQHSWLKRS
jgi:phage shock protein PspC (stress-responsive transcriptional regulator)